MSSDTDWVAVTISPRWNSACTIDAGIRVDLVGEVGQRRAPGEPDRRPVAARQRHATDRRRLHVVEFLTALLLGLATLAGRAALPAERARGTAAATTAAAATGSTTTATTTGRDHRCRRRDHGSHRHHHRRDHRCRRRDHPGSRRARHPGAHRRRDDRRAYPDEGPRRGPRDGCPVCRDGLRERRERHRADPSGAGARRVRRHRDAAAHYAAVARRTGCSPSGAGGEHRARHRPGGPGAERREHPRVERPEPHHPDGRREPPDDPPTRAGYRACRTADAEPAPRSPLPVHSARPPRPAGPGRTARTARAVRRWPGPARCAPPASSSPAVRSGRPGPRRWSRRIRRTGPGWTAGPPGWPAAGSRPTGSSWGSNRRVSSRPTQRARPGWLRHRTDVRACHPVGRAEPVATGSIHWSRWPERHPSARGRVGVAQLAHDRGFDGRGRGLDELSEVLELRHDLFAGLTELFRELMYTGLACHCSPHGEGGAGSGRARPLSRCAGCCSLLLHGVLTLGRPAFCSQAARAIGCPRSGSIRSVGPASPRLRGVVGPCWCPGVRRPGGPCRTPDGALPCRGIQDLDAATLPDRGGGAGDRG